MSDIERITITVPSELASFLKREVEQGEYASSSEIVREALRDWKLRKELHLEKLASLKADIDRGLADVAEGRIAKFDRKRIIERGRKLLAERSLSA